MKIRPIDDKTRNDIYYTDNNRLAAGIDPERGFFHLGLDSEGTGREAADLLSAPICVSWDEGIMKNAHWTKDREDRWTCRIPSIAGSGHIEWKISIAADEMVWSIGYHGRGNAKGLRIEMDLDPLLSASVLMPASLDKENMGVGPWMLVCTDFGHLKIEAGSAWRAVNTGSRGYTAELAPALGTDPELRGADWIKAVGIPGYLPGKIGLRLSYAGGLKEGEPQVIRFIPQELIYAVDIDNDLWRKIRRAYINSWQPCGTWWIKEISWVLANNVLSDPASISLRFYAEPMLFYREPVSGIDNLHLLKHSLEYWLENHVGAIGHVNAFAKMYDLYPGTGCSLIDSAWIYWTISGDRSWLKKYIPKLHLIADYILRRDIDSDGLVEDYFSGIEGTFRDPDRANIWFEMMNFGYKNAYFNLQAYRSFLCMSQMLEGIGIIEPDEEDDPLGTYNGRAGIPDGTALLRGAGYYRGKAEKLKKAFAEKMLGENGWFVSWIDLNGKVHDYCHTFINGMATAYGIVTPEEGKTILLRVAEKSKSIGFDAWHLGVPGNLIPCKKQDLIQARVGIDGEPINDSFMMPDNIRDEDIFGFRYPDGTIHPPLVWPYLLGLQTVGLDGEADRILDMMIGSAEKGLFMNGIVNVGYGGAEHFFINGKTCGYEGYLPESYNFLMAAFTRSEECREKFLRFRDIREEAI